MEYHEIRLAIAAEKIFSHGLIYARPKLHSGAQNLIGITTVHHVNSVIGKSHRLWVFGFFTQKEDTFWYLEDETYSIRVIIGD
jgi:hypothetical protein